MNPNGSAPGSGSARTARAKPDVPKLASLSPERPSAETATCPHCQATLLANVCYCSCCGATLAPDPLIGQTIDGRYEVVRLLGAGAMGAVYEVRHLRLGKRFAMKVIHRELTQVPEFLARFEREAHSTSRLQHPNCILVTDFGHAPTGELYLVMEFLQGKPLADFLERPLPVGMALEITRQVLLGVEHAHQAGVIHRDLKPENVVRVEKPDGTWQMKVVDFGIAKVVAGSGDESKPLTKANVVFGTPQYMAPEQALAGEVGERADVYAIGAMLWRMLIGRHVFDVEGQVEVLSAKLQSPAPPLDSVAPGVFSPSLQELLREALERNPSARIASATEMLRAVERIQKEPGGGLAQTGSGAARRSSWRFPTAVSATLASTGSLLLKLGSRVPQIPRTLSGVVGGWYRCDGQRGPVTWGLRLRGLVATTRGLAILAMLASLIGLTALLVVLSSPAPEPSVSKALPLPGPGRARLGPSRAPTRPGPPPPPDRKALPVAPALANRLNHVHYLLTQGTCAEAETEVRRLLSENASQARAHYLLGLSLFCRKSYREGLDAYQQAIRHDAAYRRDERIIQDAERLLRVNKLRDDALEFLGAQVGQPALPILLKLVRQAPKRSVRHRAVDLALGLGARDQIDWINTYALDLRDNVSCKERAATVELLRQLKDPRAIPVLRQARDERAGFLGFKYRNWCIRKEIVAALKELQALPGATP